MIEFDSDFSHTEKIGNPSSQSQKAHQKYLNLLQSSQNSPDCPHNGCSLWLILAFKSGASGAYSRAVYGIAPPVLGGEGGSTKADVCFMPLSRTSVYFPNPHRTPYPGGCPAAEPPSVTHQSTLPCSVSLKADHIT